MNHLAAAQRARLWSSAGTRSPLRSCLRMSSNIAGICKEVSSLEGLQRYTHKHTSERAGRRMQLNVTNSSFGGACLKGFQGSCCIVCERHGAHCQQSCLPGPPLPLISLQIVHAHVGRSLAEGCSKGVVLMYTGKSVQWCNISIELFRL